ncbi:hypothetical protein GALMADRAFT_264321 [Galerina marginata CBS 339.88]|uniref:Actin cytoskeleton-regulatory complex protein PAN1 n=1 Tax=Galerina marginata (strain CBS 339.88) TaxID=685588 RepID=A0A067TFR2_GALM3|nr:hypothetical protein GALMADRAFT_264321 [Galerina marginata CBS 339.88]
MAQPQDQPLVPDLQKVATAFLPRASTLPRPMWSCRPASLQLIQGDSLAGPSNPTQPTIEDNKLPRAEVLNSSKPADEVVQQIPWALSEKEKEAYDGIFKAWDTKNTGYFQGEKAVEAFGASGLPVDDLARIWNLADADNCGQLNIAQFQVAMGLIYRRLHGMSVPYQLPSEFSLHLRSSRSEEESPNFQEAKELVWAALGRKPVEKEDSNETSKLVEGDVTDEGVKERNAIMEALALDLVDWSWPASLPSSPRPPPPPPPPPLPAQLSCPPKPLPPLPPTSPATSFSPSEDLQGELCDLENRVQKLSDELADLAPGVDNAERRHRLEDELVSLVIGKIPEVKRKSRATAERNATPQTEKARYGGVKLRRPPPPPPPLPSMLPPQAAFEPIDREEFLLRHIRAGKKLRPTQTVVKDGLAPLLGMPPVKPSPRQGLLRSIRDGKELRPTQTVVRRNPPPPPPPLVPPVPPAESEGGGTLLRSIHAGKKLRPTQTVVKSGPYPLGNVLGDAGGHDDSLLRLLSRPPPPLPPVAAAEVQPLQDTIPDTEPTGANGAHHSVDGEAAGADDLYMVEGQSLSWSVPTYEEEEEEYVIV